MTGCSKEEEDGVREVVAGYRFAQILGIGKHGVLKNPVLSCDVGLVDLWRGVSVVVGHPWAPPQ